MFPVKISINTYFGSKIWLTTEIFSHIYWTNIHTVLGTWNKCLYSFFKILLILAADCKVKLTWINNTLKHKPNYQEFILTKPMGYSQKSAEASQQSRWECERMGHQPILDLRCELRIDSHMQNFFLCQNMFPFYTQVGLKVMRYYKRLFKLTDENNLL